MEDPRQQDILTHKGYVFSNFYDPINFFRIYVTFVQLYSILFTVYSPTGVGDLTDTSTWQTLGSGVADYLSALPLPLHHLLKYSTSEGKRDDQPTVVTVATNTMPQQSAAHTVSWVEIYSITSLISISIINH